MGEDDVDDPAESTAASSAFLAATVSATDNNDADSDASSTSFVCAQAYLESPELAPRWHIIHLEGNTHCDNKQSIPANRTITRMCVVQARVGFVENTERFRPGV